MVVFPGVRATMVSSEVKTVHGAMKISRATASYHHDLSAGRAIKVSSLPGGVYFEFFNAFDRCCDDAGGHTVGLTTGNTGKILEVTNSITGHVIGVICTIERVRVLIHVRTGNVASRFNVPR